MALNKTNGVAPINLTMLSAVNPGHKNSTICVRVVSMWRVISPMSIELVLMDSERNKIHASIERFLYKFEGDIREDLVYYISKFDVVPNSGNYRSTRHAYKIDFEFETKIWEAASESVPPTLFVFTPPALCFQPEFESDYLVDIIGVLTEIGAARQFDRNGAKSKLLDIKLDNNGYRFKVRLFGSCVDELNSYRWSGETVNPVMIILFLKLKIWKGPPTLQTTMHSSKLIFNPDIPEATALRSRIIESSKSPIGGSSQLQETKSKSIEDDFLKVVNKACVKGEPSNKFALVESNVDVTQDLMDKFTETVTEAISDVCSNATTTIIDISSNNQDTPLSKRMKLSTNTGLSSSNVNADGEEIKKFTDGILGVGDGDITIPDDFLILDTENPLQSLIDFAYPSLLTNMNNEHFFEERCILAPTRESVEHVNDYLLSLIPGEEREYLSCDTASQSDKDSGVPVEWIPMEFLNTIKCSDIPDHKLMLKVGALVMLVRDINPSSGLCNGTRLLVNKLAKNAHDVIGATIVTGKNTGKQVFIHRMGLVSSDRGLPFKLHRSQFPLAPCFAMTMDKSKGGSLSHVAIYLPRPDISHRQLYFAFSPVKSIKGLKLLILDRDKNVCRTIKSYVA